MEKNPRRIKCEKPEIISKEFNILDKGIELI